MLPLPFRQPRLLLGHPLLLLGLLLLALDALVLLLQKDPLGFRLLPAYRLGLGLGGDLGQALLLGRLLNPQLCETISLLAHALLRGALLASLGLQHLLLQFGEPSLFGKALVLRFTGAKFRFAHPLGFLLPALGFARLETLDLSLDLLLVDYGGLHRLDLAAGGCRGKLEFQPDQQHRGQQQVQQNRAANGKGGIERTAQLHRSKVSGASVIRPTLGAPASCSSAITATTSP